MARGGNVFLDRATTSRLELADDERAAVEARFEALVATDRRVKRRLGLAIAGIIGGGLAGGFALTSGLVIFGVPRTASIVVAGIAVPIALIALWFALVPRALQPTMRQALRDCGHDVCVGCGHRLDHRADDDSDARCPECGRSSQPPLGSTVSDTATRDA